jgi:hypothetical protein
MVTCLFAPCVLPDDDATDFEFSAQSIYRFQNQEFSVFGELQTGSSHYGSTTVPPKYQGQCFVSFLGGELNGPFSHLGPQKDHLHVTYRYYCSRFFQQLRQHRLTHNSKSSQATTNTFSSNDDTPSELNKSLPLVDHNKKSAAPVYGHN